MTRRMNWESSRVRIHIDNAALLSMLGIISVFEIASQDQFTRCCRPAMNLRCTTLLFFEAKTKPRQPSNCHCHSLARAILCVNLDLMSIQTLSLDERGILSPTRTSTLNRSPLRMTDTPTTPPTPPDTSAGSSPAYFCDNKEKADTSHRGQPDKALRSRVGDSLRSQLEQLRNTPDPDLASEVQSLTYDLLNDVAKQCLKYIECAIEVLEGLENVENGTQSVQDYQALPVVDKAILDIATVVSRYDATVKLYTSQAGIDQAEIHACAALMKDITSKLDHAHEMQEVLKIQALTAHDWNDCQQSLDAIQSELKELRASIYLAEEKRHIALPAKTLDLDVLAAILEEPPEGENTGTPGKKFHDDGLSRWERTSSETMLRLQSKISPLQASISLFEPRLSLFESRAPEKFQHAVKELRTRYGGLSQDFAALKLDYEKLRKELSEDKWMAVFRQVNKQASEMMNSLSRTLKKLDSVPFTNVDALQFVDAFELKSEHYGAAIPSVLSIMQKGLRDRVTLNGEILRGFDNLTRDWAQLSIDLADMARRIQGARAAGLLSTISASSSPQKLGPRSANTRTARHRKQESVPALPQASTFKKYTPRPSDSAIRTPQRSARVSSPTRAPSPSPAFRKDISLEPPRSRSRLGYAAERPSTAKVDTRPPWNGGTVARVLESAQSSGPTSPMQTPSRPASRIGVATRSRSSLGTQRPITPSAEVSHRLSSIPRKSPHRTNMRLDASTIPPVPSTPAKETLQRLVNKTSTSLVPPTTRLPSAVPATPSNQRSSLPRPKTPTSIPVSRRLVSNPETNAVPRTASRATERRPVSTLRPPSTTFGLRSESSLGMAGLAPGRRQSGIPMPSPSKTPFRS